MKAPFIGIMRHCINTDGNGVNTLVAFHGCPLKCKYCLNPQSITPNGILDNLTPRELQEIVSIDNIYFLATNGGITFGGGEPLLRSNFIREFRQICPSEWRINVETSLNVDILHIEQKRRFVNVILDNETEEDDQIIRNSSAIRRSG